MASACVNNIGISTTAAATSSYSSYGWFSPRLSFSRDADGGKASAPSPADLSEKSPDPADFEFLLVDHPASAMLPADELFSGGKLVPLHLSALKPDDASASREKSIAAVKSRRRSDASVSGNDPYLFSPKAPRCSSRWRELLGLKKLYNSSNPNPGSKIGESQKTTSSISSSSSSSSSKSIKNFLHRSSKSYSDSSSLVLPLLTSKDSSSSDSFESLSISSSRLSLSSSSSSGHDHDDLPRHSLDFPDKPPAIALRRNPNRATNPRPPAEAATVRSGRSPVRRRAAVSAAASRGVSVDSPRMNSSGKIVFQSLERSSSSPSSFCNGGPRYKHHRPMERSYSGGVRVVTPVLNVPVCSLRVGFGQLFAAPQKRSDLTNRTKSTTTRTT